MHLVLASNSPRRRELLGRLTKEFTVIPSGIDEHGAGSPAEQAVHLARAKARAVLERDGAVIIGADTMVVVDEQILGKPETRGEAAEMLRRLSGRDHWVLTGLCVWSTETGVERTHCEATRVSFRAIEETEIDAYLAIGEYVDKAGAYAIQGVAAKFVSGIAGDYTNVMGLPVCRLSLMLREVGVRL